MKAYTVHELAKTIDHSLLRPELDDKALEEGIAVALKYDTATICIKPYYVPRSVELLKGSDVKVSTVIGFPHGGNTTDVKLYEAREAIAQGSKELDIVSNIGKVLSGDWDFVSRDLARLADYARKSGVLTKVIFENCYLNDAQKTRLCEVCERAGVDFVKTSTGFGTGGATDPDLKLMRANCSPRVQVKAAGGVRTLDRLLEVLALGVTRVGATATAVILDEAAKRVAEGKALEA
jgi:deoxyribose-phosphate aldolase